MRLTEEAYQEFKRLWSEDHPGLEIDELRLREIALCLLLSVKLVNGPIHRDDLEEYRKIQREEV